MNEKTYDKINNEGGEGYNPYREARKLAEWEDTKNNYSRTDRKYNLLNKLATNGNNELMADTVAKWEAELAEIKADEETEFAAEWTPEVTKARRTEWNNWVKAQGKGIPADKVTRKLAEMNMTLDDLKKAVQMHNM